MHAVGACCSGKPRNGAISCARVDLPLVPRRKFGIDYELYLLKRESVVATRASQELSRIVTATER